MKIDTRITVTPELVQTALTEIAGGDETVARLLRAQLGVDSFAPFDARVPSTIVSNPAQLLAYLMTTLASGKTVAMHDMPGAAPKASIPVQMGPAENAPPPKAQRATPTYGKDITGVKSPQDILERSERFDAIVDKMVEEDVVTVLGRTPQGVRTRFGLGPEWTDARISAFMSSAKSRLGFATQRVRKHLSGDGFTGVEWSKLSADDQHKVIGQHSNYVAGVLARDKGLDKQACRGVLQMYLTTADGSPEGRQELAEQLARLGEAPDEEATREWVMSSDQDWLFHPDACRTGGAVLKNLASEYSGAAILALAEELVGGSRSEAAGLLNTIFRRSDYELSEQLRNARGPEGMLLHLAGAANHLAWGTATMSVGIVKARDGDASAIKAWKHPDLRPSWIVLAEDESTAPKLVDQLEAFMLSSGMMIPRDRSTHRGRFSQMEVLDDVFKSGVCANETDATISLNARRVTDIAIGKLRRYGTLSSVYAGAGAQASAEVVAEIAATFAARATGSSENELNDLKRLYYSPLMKLMPEVMKLFELRQSAGKLQEESARELKEAGGTKPGSARSKAETAAKEKAKRAEAQMKRFDELYGQLYSNFAGKVGYEALKELGESKAQDTARFTGLVDLCRSAAHNLRMEVPAEYLRDPSLIAKDIEGLGNDLMKGDYFLGQPDFVKNLQEDAKKALPKDKAEALASHVEHAARLPNAIWFFVSLVRGLVEPGRLKRFESAGLHSNPNLLQSDQFPDALQFNMPDVRDLDLFHWAQHRLSKYHGKDEGTAQRQAFAVVVLTLYKDLIQIQKGAGVR